MARRYETNYRVKPRMNLGDPEFWNRRFDDIDRRMDAVELGVDDIKLAADNLIAIGLSRLNDTFAPLIEEARHNVTTYGVSFSGSSNSSVTIGTGTKTFILTEATRSAYYFPDYVAIRAVSDITKSMTAQVTSYDRETGELVVNSVLTTGSGTFTSWDIRLGAAPDLTHATRTDNPHATTAAQVGAYTTTETDDAIAAGLATINLSFALNKSLNFSDVANKSSARDNLGLGSAAVHPASDFVTPSTLSSYATQSWVNGRGFLTSSSLTGYATQSWVGGLGYATQSWVGSQGYGNGLRLTSAFDLNVLDGPQDTLMETSGAVITGYQATGSTEVNYLRFRYLQMLIAGAWYTCGSD